MLRFCIVIVVCTQLGPLSLAVAAHWWNAGIRPATAPGAGVRAMEEVVRPTLTTGLPAPGKFVTQVSGEFCGTGVYHALYLPVNWKPGHLYPVIVEFAPNQWNQFSGKVDDCRLGFYQSGGKDFIWVVMPYIDSVKKENIVRWWGDETATVNYCLTNLRRICESFGGDPNAIFLTGFSRGAIACGYIGLRDETIADVWLAFLPHSHMDGGRFTVAGAGQRLARTRGRATFVTYGEKDDGKQGSLKGLKMLRDMGFPVVEREVPGIEHTDLWIEKDGPIRQEMRAWIADVLAHRPGTHTVRGRVVDAEGKGIPGVRVQCGAWHWAITGADGRYAIPSLTPGTRKLVASKPEWTWQPVERQITLKNADVEAPLLIGVKNPLTN